MWVRMLSNPGGAKIDRIDTIPVAVDVHVRRVTENLRVTSTRGRSLRASKPAIQSAWREAVAKAAHRRTARYRGHMCRARSGSVVLRNARVQPLPVGGRADPDQPGVRSLSA